MVGNGHRPTGPVGRAGEDAAAQWLSDHGLRIVDRNWRSGHKEIDIVAESPERLHIVEVKTLSVSEDLTSALDPAEKVGSAKQSRLIAAAKHYIAVNHILKEVQFDVVAVRLHSDGLSDIEYIPEAFIPIVR